MPDIVIPATHNDRLLVREVKAPEGERYVQIIPQTRGDNGVWIRPPFYPGLLLSPEEARLLAPALTALAAGIEAHAYEPAPTEEDRELSRRE